MNTDLKILDEMTLDWWQITITVYFFYGQGSSDYPRRPGHSPSELDRPRVEKWVPKRYFSLVVWVYYVYFKSVSAICYEMLIRNLKLFAVEIFKALSYATNLSDLPMQGPGQVHSRSNIYGWIDDFGWPWKGTQFVQWVCPMQFKKENHILE